MRDSFIYDFQIHSFSRKTIYIIYIFGKQNNSVINVLKIYIIVLFCGVIVSCNNLTKS